MVNVRIFLLFFVVSYASNQSWLNCSIRCDPCTQVSRTMPRRQWISWSSAATHRCNTCWKLGSQNSNRWIDEFVSKNNKEPRSHSITWFSSKSNMAMWVQEEWTLNWEVTHLFDVTCTYWINIHRQERVSIGQIYQLPFSHSFTSFTLSSNFWSW